MAQQDPQIDVAFQFSWWDKDKPGFKKNPPLAQPPEKSKDSKDKSGSKAKNESFKDFLTNRNLN